jgi:hypothetical protein
MSNIDSRTQGPNARSIQDDDDFDSIVAQDHAHSEFFRSLLEPTPATASSPLRACRPVSFCGCDDSGFVVTLVMA